MKRKDDILKLRSEGKSYREIQAILGCSKGLIAYHCGSEQKEKARKRVYKSRSKHPYIRKYYQFIDQSRNGQKKDVKRYQYKVWSQVANFVWQDIVDKFGENPNCYLCGSNIDIYETLNYSFDHIIPFSKNGPCTLENLGLACKFCNTSKNELNPEEYYAHCKKVLENQGYTIVGSAGNDPARNLP